MPKLAVIKTKQTTSSVTPFIDSIADEQKRKDILDCIIAGSKHFS